MANRTLEILHLLTLQSTLLCPQWRGVSRSWFWIGRICKRRCANDRVLPRVTHPLGMAAD